MAEPVGDGGCLRVRRARRNGFGEGLRYGQLRGKHVVYRACIMRVPGVNGTRWGWCRDVARKHGNLDTVG
jgi:hypothetical protein